MGGRCLRNRPHLEAEKAGKDGTLFVVCERCGETLRLASDDLNQQHSASLSKLLRK
jgi:hypothetical protein